MKLAALLICLGSAALAEPLPAPAAEGPARASEPSPEDQRAAEKLLQDVYRSDYAEKTRQGMQRLARRLLKQGVEETAKQASSYVCLREARELAAKCGDALTLMLAVAEMASRFDVDGPAMRKAGLAATAKTVRTPEEARPLAEACLAVTVESLSASDYDGAKKMAAAASAAAKLLRDTALSACARDLAAEVSEVQARHEKVKDAEKRLKASPEDPDAKLAVGKFLCLYLRDWARGLPLLAKGSDIVLLKLAEEDRAGTDDPARQMQVGKAWGDLAEKAKGVEEVSLRLRSAWWYARAARGSKGLDREKALQALEAIAAKAPCPIPTQPGIEAAPGFAFARFNGQDLRGWDVLNGVWRVQAGRLLSAGDHENRLLRSWQQASWMRIEFEFQGGNPGLYFVASREASKGPGFNLDAEAKNNGELRIAVDMQAWNSFRVDVEGQSQRVYLNGKEVHSGSAGAPTCLLVKANRGELRVRKLVALGWRS